METIPSWHRPKPTRQSPHCPQGERGRPSDVRLAVLQPRRPSRGHEPQPMTMLAAVSSLGGLDIPLQVTGARQIAQLGLWVWRIVRQDTAATAAPDRRRVPLDVARTQPNYH